MADADITIRRMILSDIQAAAALERECFSQPWSEHVYAETLANENTLYLAAEDRSGALIGMCGLLDILGKGDISNVAVKEAFRKQGIAERMLSELLRQGKERGVTEFILEVRVSNEAAIRLYKKLGFFAVGRRKGFYEFPKEDALILKSCVQEDE